MNNDIDSAKPHRRTNRQFGLLALLFVVAACGVATLPLVWRRQYYERQYERYLELGRSGARVTTRPVEPRTLRSILGDSRGDYLVEPTVVDFSGQAIEDSALDALGDSGTIHRVLLRDTPISDAGLERLANLQGLESLDLSGTRITDAGLRHIADLHALRDLDLSNTSISDRGLGHLAELRQLVSLRLLNTDVSCAGLMALEQLTSLTELRISNRTGNVHECNERAFRSIGRLANLEKLSVSNLPVTDACLAHLESLTSMTDLVFIETQVDGRGFSHLSKLKHLRRLSVGGPRFGDAGLEYLAVLPGLEVLNVRNSPVSDAGLPRLAKFAALSFARFDHCSVSMEAVTSMQAAIPGITIVCH